MKAVVIALLLLVASVYGAEFGFSRNVSLSGNADNWTYRRTSLSAISAGFLESAVFSSISVGGTGNSISGDAIFGAAYIGADSVPLNFLAYFDANVTFEFSDIITGINGSAAAGFIGSAYLAIEERNATGYTVSVQYLGNSGSFSWTQSAIGVPAAGNPQVSYVTYLGQLPGTQWSISITYVVSSVTGVLTYADAIVSPKSFETIIEIDNWPYQTDENYLTLIAAVATGSGTASGNAYLYGSGTTSVYFRVGASAVVDGTISPVSHNGYSSFDYYGYLSYYRSTPIYAKLEGRFQASVSVNLINISFPAGASNIVYDPDTGSGTPVGDSTTASSSASYLPYSILLFLSVMLLSLF